MKNFISKHKVIFCLICLGIFIALIGIPFIIHVFFKLKISVDFWSAEWSAGDVLGYYGAILSFIGTVVLGTLAMYQNHIIKEEADKQAKILENRVLKENMPKFEVKFNSYNGRFCRYSFLLGNISENIATDIKIYNIQLLEKEKEPVSIKPQEYKIQSLVNNYNIIQLENESICSESFVISMSMECKDKYETKHEYVIKLEVVSNKPELYISEIKRETS